MGYGDGGWEGVGYGEEGWEGVRYGEGEWEGVIECEVWGGGMGGCDRVWGMGRRDGRV